jgi:hypothetical protein
MPTPKEQGAVVDATCELLQAFGGTPAEMAICATASDLVSLEAEIRSARSDAGAGRLGRGSGKCQIIKTVCATDEELAGAIKVVRK